MEGNSSPARHALGILAILALAACGGGGGGMPAGGMSPTVYAIGGTLSGLVPAAGTGSQLVLSINGADDLFLNQNGAFHFSKALSGGASYSVTIKIPAMFPPQDCVIANGSGSAGPNSLDAISVKCALSTFTIGGTVSGMRGSGLVLTDWVNPDSEKLPISANGPFTFKTPLATRSPYGVAVITQPSNPNDTCSVENDSGDVKNSDITNVQVTCLPNIYTVGGNVSGLAGSGLMLAVNGTASAVNTNGPFTLPPLLAEGTEYTVTVTSQPSGPIQSCVVPNSVGTLGAGSVATINVICSAPRFAYAGGGHGNDVLAYTVDVANGALTPIAGSPFAAGDSTRAVAVDPTNHFLYAANQGATAGPGSNTVSAFSIDAATGALTPVAGSPFPSAIAPFDIAVTPDGQYLYLANLHDNTVSGYRIAAGNGALTPVTAGPTEPGIDGPRHLTMHPSGHFLYLTSPNEDEIWAYSIDAASGALSPLAGNPVTITNGSVVDETSPAKHWSPSTIINPNGNYLYLANLQAAIDPIESILLDPSSGGLGPSYTLQGWALASQIVMEPGATYGYSMYNPLDGVSNGYIAGLEVIPFNGFAGLLDGNPSQPVVTFNSRLASIYADPSGRFVYVVDSSGNAFAYIIDHTSGALTPAAETPTAIPPGQPFLIIKQ